MADNVTYQTTTLATPPNATVVATDDVGGAHYQRMKLVDPTDGSTTPLIGQKARTGSLPVALSTEDAALLADLLTNTAFQARIPTNGQKAMAASLPVVIASDQSTVPVSVASIPLPSGAATEATLSALNTKIPASPATDRATAAAPNSARLSDGTSFYKATTPSDTQPVSAASLPLPSGAATETTLGTRLSESDFDTKIGSLTETAPATDTASSGLNGRLQRIAQRLTSLIALVPASLGQKTMANSFAVTVASDQSSLSTLASQGTAAAATAGWPTIFGRPTTAALTSASINAASSGDNSLVAGVSSQTIRVFRIFLVATSAVTLKFRDGTTDLTGGISLTAGGAIVLDFQAEPWFVTSTAAAFQINLSSAAQVSGRIYYVQS
jgi:hypothetical protein